MFDEILNNLKDFVSSKVQEVGEELEKRFGVPEPAGEFVLIRRFSPTDSTVTKGGIAIIEASWQIEAYDDNTQRLITRADPLRNVILFEVSETNLPECVLACRCYAKALNTEKSIQLSLGISRKGQWGTTTRYWSTGISPSEDFHLYEARAHFKKETDSAKVQITVQFESSGILQIRDIELLQAPAKSRS
ncbi:hypothetical protein BV372_34380 [Nostoc sp. T09]|uniref:hypothetical protein n=1 Tax=Nostoc sp. T09 TaxID=1932621 RepID=UPI000A366235|nr:hypothetical protein [Nostoc sp. T09]OUL18167.1 hypothetical protein BV372_34380 [Nostoc sp. T09]